MMYVVIELDLNSVSRWWVLFYLQSLGLDYSPLKQTELWARIRSPKILFLIMTFVVCFQQLNYTIICYYDQLIINQIYNMP